MLAILLAGLVHAEPPPVVNGEPTSEPLAVGAFAALEGTSGAVFCSGTLISSEWVLTAGHCLVGAESYEDIGLDIVFLIGDDAGAASGVVDYEEVVRMELHPDYEDSPYLVNDIALMKLAAPLTAADPIQPSAVGPDDSDWPDEDVLFVGWGITSDSAVDAGVKREARMPTIGYDEYYFYVLDEEDGQNLCSGDSGGAALIENSAGELELAGVNSFVFTPDSSVPACVGGGAGATRVDQYLSWIESVMSATDYDSPGSGDGSGATGGFFVDDEKGGCATVSGATGGLLAWLALGSAVLRRRRDGPSTPTRPAGRPRR